MGFRMKLEDLLGCTGTGWGDIRTSLDEVDVTGYVILHLRSDYEACIRGKKADYELVRQYTATSYLRSFLHTSSPRPAQVTPATAASTHTLLVLALPPSHHLYLDPEIRLLAEPGTTAHLSQKD